MVPFTRYQGFKLCLIISTYTCANSQHYNRLSWAVTVCLLDVGSNVFVLHLIICCAVDPRLSDLGVFIYSRRAKYGLCLSECTSLQFEQPFQPSHWIGGNGGLMWSVGNSNL